jgi:hypothetical protein
MKKPSVSTTSAMLKASLRVLREHRRLPALPALSITAEAVGAAIGDQGAEQVVAGRCCLRSIRAAR